jgi:hypothetical protein
VKRFTNTFDDIRYSIWRSKLGHHQHGTID